MYPVTDADPVTAIFCDSHNYIYNTALTTGGVPYGVNGFIVVHKGGDAAVFKAGQALATSWPDHVTFQTQIGVMAGDTVGGALGTEPANAITFP